MGVAVVRALSRFTGLGAKANAKTLAGGSSRRLPASAPSTGLAGRSRSSSLGDSLTPAERAAADAAVDAAWGVGPGADSGRYSDAYDSDPYRGGPGGPGGGAYGDEFDRGGYPSYDPYGAADPYGITPYGQQQPGQARPAGMARQPTRELSDSSNGQRRGILRASSFGTAEADAQGWGQPPGASGSGRGRSVAFGGGPSAAPGSRAGGFPSAVGSPLGGDVGSYSSSLDRYGDEYDEYRGQSYYYDDEDESTWDALSGAAPPRARQQQQQQPAQRGGGGQPSWLAHDDAGGPVQPGRMGGGTRMENLPRDGAPLAPRGERGR